MTVDDYLSGLYKKQYAMERHTSDPDGHTVSNIGEDLLSTSDGGDFKQLSKDSMKDMKLIGKAMWRCYKEKDDS